MYDIRYIAGFFDGEGSIGIYGKRPCLRVCIVQVKNKESKSLFEYLVKRFGGSIHNLKKFKPNHNQAFTWVVFGNSALPFLSQVSNLLVLKKTQALLALSYQRKYGRPRNTKKDPAFTEKVRVEGSKLSIKLSKMKLKGPKLGSKYKRKKTKRLI